MSLVSSDGLLNQLVKSGLETALEGELTEHLGPVTALSDSVELTMIATMPAIRTSPPITAHSSPRRPELWLIITGQPS